MDKILHNGPLFFQYHTIINFLFRKKWTVVSENNHTGMVYCGERKKYFHRLLHAFEMLG